MLNQKGFAPIIFIGVIIGSFLLVSAGYFLGRKEIKRNNQPSASTPLVYSTLNQVPARVPSPTPPPGPKCGEYKQFSNDELYTKYTVRPGDSILSVARKQLGDPSKIGQIIQLNKDRYPYIENNSFLELGWVLYLPNKDATPDNYLIGGISGKIALITNEYFGVTNAQATNTTYVYHSRVPQYASNFLFKVGDCVTAKYFSKDQAPYAIVLQPTNQNTNNQTDQNATSEVTIDFATCNLEKQTTAVAMGSTTYQMKRVNNSTCEMDYGGEIENPRWDGNLLNHCQIPIALGKMTFTKGQYGVDFSTIQQYCTH